jgi:hypothetical protein
MAMLVIRSAQMEVFKEAALRSFENEMVAHLAEFSPPLFKAVGEEQMREVIHFGIGKADSYGFTFRGPVRLYLDLMLLFGSHFDTDPQYPWAAEILTDQDSGLQMQRAERLYEKTMDYREKVAGPEDAYTLRALRNISVLARQPLELSSDNFVPAMRQEIARVYPQKAVYVGDEGINALIRKGVDGARRQRFSTIRGATLVIVLMLAFGHGCGADPLYPWIARTLKDEAITDPETRAKRLEKKALTWLEHVLAYFEKGAQA